MAISAPRRGVSIPSLLSRLRIIGKVCYADANIAMGQKGRAPEVKLVVLVLEMAAG